MEMTHFVTDILAGNIKMLFISPESMFLDPWRDWLRSKKKQICLVTVDEAHCITAWYNTVYRPTLLYNFSLK